MKVLFPILVSVTVVSLISLVGILIFLRKKTLNKILFYLVSFAAGSMLGAAFLDLLPETIAKGYNEIVPILILFGILISFILEKFLNWHHHHTGHQHEEVHAFTYLNLVGDGLHNFVDGVIIAVSYMSSSTLGITATIAIIAHEIPQEIGDFGILIYGGFSKAKALIYNFLSALTAILGALLAFFYSGYIKDSTIYISAFAVGGFIYIAGTDLIPEIQKEKDLRKSLIQLILMFLGVAIIWLVGKMFEGH